MCQLLLSPFLSQKILLSCHMVKNDMIFQSKQLVQIRKKMSVKFQLFSFDTGYADRRILVELDLYHCWMNKFLGQNTFTSDPRQLIVPSVIILDVCNFQITVKINLVQMSQSRATFPYWCSYFMPERFLSGAFFYKALAPSTIK